MTTTQGFTIATSVDDALAAMADGATVVAGGTDLVVGHRQGKAPLPDNLVAIDRIADMTAVAAANGGLRVGALVTHSMLMSDPTIVSDYSALADSAALVGSPATRNVGTLGGNIMNASPAMDTGAPLVVLRAQVELQSRAGHRIIDPLDLWTGPGTTSAGSDELLTACLLPTRPERSGSAYVRLEYRRAMEIAVVGAAAAAQLDDAGNLTSVDLALTAVGPTILKVDTVGLGGRPLDQSLSDDLADLARETASPISDLRAGDRYRRHCIGVMAQRAVDAAVQRASGQEIAIPVNRAIGIGASRNNPGSGSQ